MSYGAAMRWWAEREPEREAIVHADERAVLPAVSRGELEQRANRLARDYQQRGVMEGDLVTVALPNSIEFFAACLALWKLGATPQPVSSRLPRVERQAIIDLVDPPLVIGAPPGECGARSALPVGHEPAPGLSGDPLPECAPHYARAMTSGGERGERHEAGRYHAGARPSLPRWALHDLVELAALGRARDPDDPFRRRAGSCADRAVPRRLGALRADDDAAHLATARSGAGALRPVVPRPRHVHRSTEPGCGSATTCRPSTASCAPEHRARPG
jgi:hypothetical protein